MYICLHVYMCPSYYTYIRSTISGPGSNVGEVSSHAEIFLVPFFHSILHCIEACHDIFTHRTFHEQTVACPIRFKNHCVLIHRQAHSMHAYT